MFLVNWGSGGYSPYNSSKGKVEHDELKVLITKHI